MDRCSRCGAENAATTKYCGECGSKFVPRPAAVAVDGDEGAYYCFKHKKEPTRVTCGRCEKPICHKCLIVGPAGVRCRECARRKAPVRIRGVVHDAGRGLGNLGAQIGSRPVWYLWIWMMILNFFRGFFR